MKIKGRPESVSLFIVALIIIIFVTGNHSAASASLTTKLDIRSGGRLDQIPFPFDLTRNQVKFQSEKGASVGDELNLFIYLPIILKPLPSPVLSPINNPDGDANYSVSWNSIDLATSYVLEEDDNGAFSSPMSAYSGASTSWLASGHAVGTYYYRVKARNSSVESAWSNIQSTTVVPPQSNAYVSNDTGCTLCFEVFDTGIGQKCFSSAGDHFYGSFPVGNYKWTASACCGSMSDTEYFGSTWSYRFFCRSSVTPQEVPLRCNARHYQMD